MHSIEMRGITKIYPSTGLVANDSVDLTVRQGEIHCIAGENGAGKTTLMKILYGMESPNSGQIFVCGKEEQISSPLQANSLGIGMVHQHFMLVPDYTVGQNVVMGVEPRKWGFAYDMATANKKVNEVIEKHNFSIAAEQKISDLTVGQMQQAEIVKMLYRNVDFLILDEPTAVLTEKEIESFFHTIRELCENNKALILITHKLHEIKRISHRVAIMRKGRMIGDYDTDDLSVNDISSMMIGRETASTIPKLERKQDRRNPVLRFEKVAVKRKKQDRPLLQDISFTAYGGEILGFAGVGGNGLGTLEAVLGGFLSVTSGSIYHRGQDITAKNTRKLRESGLAYVPSDRLQVGSALQARVKENIIVADRHRYFPKGLMDERSVDAYADEILRQYEIKAQADMPVGTLSGGNIQKLILAREMHRLQDYIVFSEPTWGLDVASGNFVYDQIKNLRDDGAAVIVISSNLDEILAIADRIIVFYRGMIVLQIDNDDSSNISKQMIGDYMLGIKK